MKKIYVTISILLFSFGCKAQSPILDVEKKDFWTSQTGAYYKDINNFYDDFEGTWKYTNGNTSFTISLEKKVKRYSGKFYIDGIIGEYKYIENGVEKINTFTDSYERPSLWYSSLLKSYHKPDCNNCPTNERRLRIIFSDRVRDLTGKFTLKKITINGQPALEVLLWGNRKVFIDIDNPSPYTKLTVPTGNYILIKQ